MQEENFKLNTCIWGTCNIMGKNKLPLLQSRNAPKNEVYIFIKANIADRVIMQVKMETEQNSCS